MVPGTQTLKLREAEIVTTEGVATAHATFAGGVVHSRNNDRRRIQVSPSPKQPAR